MPWVTRGLRNGVRRPPRSVHALTTDKKSVR